MKVLIQRQGGASAARVPIREKLAARGLDLDTVRQSP